MRDVRFGGVVWRMRRAERIALFSTRASLRMCLRPRFFVDGAAWWCLVRLFFGVDVFVESRALRVFPAETRLTVYRRLSVLLAWGSFIKTQLTKIGDMGSEK